jgi:hypothetical protein
VNPQVAARFERYRARYEGLTVPSLKKELGVEERTEEKLRFDPAAARYFDVVARELKLTAAERALLRKQGVVSVDHVQAYSMGSAYYAIYTRDLPVFVTTDSILHALHRSYDELLKDLEVGLFTATIDSVLSDVHAELGKRVRGTTDPSLLTSLRDIDLYLTVARNLLAGAGAPLDQSGVPVHLQEKSAAGLLVGSEAGMEKEAAAIIDNVASLRLQNPESPTRIYGGARPIDYSQFRPRGHYTELLALKTYFRAMMWLGRADTGWFLAPPAPQSLLQVDVSRERRNAAILAHLLDGTKTLGRLTAMSSIVDFMVGGADNLSPQVLVTAASRQQLTKLADFADDKRVAAVFDGLGEESSQQIRSQVLNSDPNDPAKVPPPALFQLFGQRFLIDSFVLSQVVYDSITFEKQKQPRWLPTGLDVMAALGSDEAVRLLEPELERYKYSANLLAARKVVADYSDDAWRSNLYNGWVNALRTLDDVPAKSPRFPQAMRTSAWAKKELQTQLASWAELRHDTLLYGKQSYTASAACEYPEGFVEPYPEFFATLKRFAAEANRRLLAADISHPDPQRARNLAAVRERYVTFFRRFESVMRALESIARKELAATPLSREEAQFLKKTIDVRGGGSGPPRYDGWYPGLIAGGGPSTYKPTVADVHTYPGDLQPPAALEVATGNVNFLVVAVDNDNDRAIYVGPVYSYYEFTVPPTQRLTDEQWLERLGRGDFPKRPPWINAIQPTVEKRQLGPPPQRQYEPPSAEKQQKRKQLDDERARVSKQLRPDTSPKQRERIEKALRDIQNKLMRLEGSCRCPPGDDDCPC